MFPTEFLAYLRRLPLGTMARCTKGAVLSAALRATVAFLTMISRHLALSDAERQVILVRVQAALLGARA